MKTLTELGYKHSTDKTVDHKFTDWYDSRLNHMRERVMNVLEVGVFYAQSLRMWTEYFSNANIYGIDIEDRRLLAQERMFIEQGDQTNIPFIQSVFGDIKFDLIIDDGGHTMFQQQTTLVNIFDRLNSGGVYILEDLHTSLHHPNKQATTLQLLQDIIDEKTSFDGYYVAAEDIIRVQSQIRTCELLMTNNGHSITSCITKK